MTVELVAGGLAVDDRGELQFCNDFDFMKDQNIIWI